MRRSIRIIVYLNPEEVKLIEVYAEQAGRSISDYMRRAGLSEGPRHLSKPKLLELIDARFAQVLKNQIPARGEANGGDMDARRQGGKR